jgi:CheY-like chemotaxis protein
LARKILLADDSVTAQNMGRRILADAGYEVITVNNGSAALKKIAEHKPDLVVLDVYMPGYSGLEVCQRIKDTRETARVPVLLTVGKLEPFKPDEAKRARADAFIVKPFEASELLSALTKLEDKIVPEARRPKGRFGKALMEQSEGEEQFGDRETGWKDRLNIPTPGQKAEQPAAPASSTESREPERAQDFQPSEVEQPLPAGLPADITAEELAAIQAAAATVAQAAEESSAAKPDAGIVEPTEENAAEATPASYASAPQTAVDAAGPSTETAAAGDAYDKDAGGSVGMQAASVAADSEKALPAAEVSSEKPSAPDADVLAAIASLAPADAQSVSTSSAAGVISSGPRWIAEPVPMSDEDSTYVLEHEMEKTYAAIAAAEAGRAVAVAAGAEAIGPSSQPLMIEDVVTPGAAEQSGAAVSIPETNEEAAYAAAASASGITPLAVSDTRVASNAPVMEEGEKHREAELAAAWQNWKQIRESIVGSGITAQIADVAAAGLKAADQPPEPPATQAEPESEHTTAPSSSDSKAESAAIASIVDSVLAELKPKLVEEIARKMSSNRKK